MTEDEKKNMGISAMFLKVGNTVSISLNKAEDISAGYKSVKNIYAKIYKNKKTGNNDTYLACECINVCSTPEFLEEYKTLYGQVEIKANKKKIYEKYSIIDQLSLLTEKKRKFTQEEWDFRESTEMDSCLISIKVA